MSSSVQHWNKKDSQGFQYWVQIPNEPIYIGM